jgi:hypothetical protein
MRRTTASRRDPRRYQDFTGCGNTLNLRHPRVLQLIMDSLRYWVREMHVDGGTMAQVFLYPPTISAKVKELEKERAKVRERRLYIIRNSRLDPEWAQVDRRTLTIAGRAISSLIQMQGIGDLYRLYLTAQQDGLDYNLAYVPSSFNVPKKEDFDTAFMRQLFDVGYSMAAKGYPWQKTPPGYQPLAGPGSK